MQSGASERWSRVLSAAQQIKRQVFEEKIKGRVRLFAEMAKECVSDGMEAVRGGGIGAAGAYSAGTTNQ